MCARSRSYKKIDRPFAAELWAKAKMVAEQYQIVLQREPDELWIGHGLEMPLVFGEGPTADACVADTREALAAAVATVLEQGEIPPRPAREGARSFQVNVKLTAEEKAVLESRARQRGFRGLSDFMRAKALET